MFCHADHKMAGIQVLLLLSFFFLPVTIPAPSHTIQCDSDNYSFRNRSIHHFQHVRQLVLEDCALETFPEVLSTLSKLGLLDLGSNKLVRIPSRVFKSNRSLRRLNMARNMISFVTRQSFVGRRLWGRLLTLTFYSFLCCQVCITWSILTCLTMTFLPPGSRQMYSTISMDSEHWACHIIEAVISVRISFKVCIS